MHDSSSASAETPSSVADAGEHHPYVLPIHGFQGTPEQIERQWFEQCYKGRGDSMAQLTWRAVLMGSVLGGVLSLTNIYIGLKAGWGFGVAITACILSYAIWTTFHRIGWARTKMTILENNCMQSTASSAGYSTGGTLVSAFAAYIMLNNEQLPVPLVMAWVFFLAVLGVTMAIPMKRQMINVEQLRFPSGIAAAETLTALHSTGNKGARAATALFLSAGLTALSTFLTEGFALIDKVRRVGEDGFRLASISIGEAVDKLNALILPSAWMGRTIHLVWEPIFIAAGAITGMRVCFSMLLGGTLCWGVFVPWLQSAHGVGEGYRELVQWTLWAGVACMVTSGLLSFALQWRMALRAFSGFTKYFRRQTPGASDDMDAIETPGSWFVTGQIVSLIGLAFLAHFTFQMPVWQTVLAVALSFFLALVACRVTGETDTTPVGAMGKIMQLTFGAISPGNMNVNLMSANITAGAAGSAADLLTDLKSGYLLGANPRKQFIAQFAGIFAGTLVTATCFRLLVPSADVLGTDQFPAPAAQAWKAVAEALGMGLHALDPLKVKLIVIGGLVGLALPLLSLTVPPAARKYIPSPAGLGLAWTFHWFYSLLFFTGAVIGWSFEKSAPKKSEEYTFPVASGVIAGGSLMGVLLVAIETVMDLMRASAGG